MDPEPYDVLAVELSSFQLHCTALDVGARPAAVLNVAEDHLDWHGSTGRRTPRDKGRIYERVQLACVYNVADPATEQLVARPTWSRAPARSASPSGCRRSGMLGVVDDVLADRAFVERPATRSAAELARSPTSRPAGPAQRRQRAGRCRAGPRPRRPAGRGPRRAARVPPRRAPDRRRRRGRRRRPTSTTPRPPTRTPRRRRCRPTTRSCGSPAGWPRARASTTWSPRSRDRLRGVVLLGADRDVIAEALSRHAPDVPRDRGRRTASTGVMDRVVAAAATLAAARRHRAAGSGMRVHGHVRQLRRTRRRLRRGGPTPDGGRGHDD